MDGAAGLNASEMFGATDCINGTVLQRDLFGTDYTNYTVLIDVHQKHGPENKYDPVSKVFVCCKNAELLSFPIDWEIL